MNCNSSLLFSIFIVISTIQLNAAENCVLQYPFQWILKSSKCHSYDYCLAFDEHRWQTIQFATKTAYPLNGKPTMQSHFDLESKCNTDIDITWCKKLWPNDVYTFDFLFQRLYTIKNMVINKARHKTSDCQWS